MNPQAEKIYQILLDYGWHCDIDWQYATGHGRRFTDINRYLEPKGQKLDWDWCDCGRHTTKLMKRRIIPLDQPFTHERHEKPVLGQNLSSQTPSKFVQDFLNKDWGGKQELKQETINQQQLI